jgi:hypothetical protein
MLALVGIVHVAERRPAPVDVVAIFVGDVPA